MFIHFLIKRTKNQWKNLTFSWLNFFSSFLHFWHNTYLFIFQYIRLCSEFTEFWFCFVFSLLLCFSSCLRLDIFETSNCFCYLDVDPLLGEDLSWLFLPGRNPPFSAELDRPIAKTWNPENKFLLEFKF
jgi:hypothetical protein